MRVVAINGSPRREGNTHDMLQAALQPLVDAGHLVELFQIGGKDVRGCLACDACQKAKNGACPGRKDYLTEIMPSVMNADALILGSPTYFADVTAEMKAFIDRVGRVARCNDHALKRKLGAAVVTQRREGGIHAFDTMNHLFTISQMIVVGSSYWNDGIGAPKGAAAKDQESMDIMFTLGHNMAWLMKKLEEA